MANGSERLRPFVVSFVAACSGSGKTTLLERVVGLLCARGVRVGVIKHTGKPFEMDRPGKDSYRLAQAGAEEVALVSDRQLGLIRRLCAPVPFGELPGLFENADIILTEGGRESRFPKIEVHRRATGAPLLCTGVSGVGYVAVASDEPLRVPLPVLDLNDAEAVVGFVMRLSGLSPKGEASL